VGGGHNDAGADAKIVLLFVCLSVISLLAYLKNHTSKFSVYVNCGRG